MQFTTRFDFNIILMLVHTNLLKFDYKTSNSSLVNLLSNLSLEPSSTSKLKLILLPNCFTNINKHIHVYTINYKQ